LEWSQNRLPRRWRVYCAGVLGTLAFGMELEWATWTLAFSLRQRNRCARAVRVARTWLPIANAVDALAQRSNSGLPINASVRRSILALLLSEIGIGVEGE
jgi:hypothetical protein